MEATRVLQKTIQASQKYKIICHEGGSRSSKTWSIFQYFLLKAIQGERFRLTIARNNLSWIRSTLLVDFDEITRYYNIPVEPNIDPNRHNQIYRIFDKSRPTKFNAEFGFFGLDYAEKLHGRKQDYTWLNEVMEVDKKSFDQLEMRTFKDIILDYNPTTDDHWVFDIQKRPDVTVIKSTMLDNPFLPPSIIKKIKSYEPTPENIAQGTADLYMWEVYGLGNRARLQGAIFKNWDVVDDLPRDEEGNVIAKFICYGLDFGFSNDPTALIAIYINNGEIYLDELIYQPGLTNSSNNPDDDTIVKRLRDLNISYNEDIVADSSEPKSIEEIRREGFNIYGAEKGPDSVNFGIDLMQGYKIHITKRSINLEKEFRMYKWAEDKTGRPLNKPVDAYNHGGDAARYGISTKLRRNSEPSFHTGYGLGI